MKSADILSTNWRKVLPKSSQFDIILDPGLQLGKNTIPLIRIDDKDYVMGIQLATALNCSCSNLYSKMKNHHFEQDHQFRLHPDDRKHLQPIYDIVKNTNQNGPIMILITDSLYEWCLSLLGEEKYVIKNTFTSTFVLDGTLERVQIFTRNGSTGHVLTISDSQLYRKRYIIIPDLNHCTTDQRIKVQTLEKIVDTYRIHLNLSRQLKQKQIIDSHANRTSVVLWDDPDLWCYLKERFGFSKPLDVDLVDFSSVCHYNFFAEPPDSSDDSEHDIVYLSENDDSNDQDYTESNCQNSRKRKQIGETTEKDKIYSKHLKTENDDTSLAVEFYKKYHNVIDKLLPVCSHCKNKAVQKYQIGNDVNNTIYVCENHTLIKLY